MEKPFAPACERNQDPILNILQSLLVNKKAVFEVGSGTGQHAVYFAKNMPHIVWQTSDLVEKHNGINLWIDASKLKNVKAPISFDVNKDELESNHYDAVFTANTFHIMSWEECCKCISKLSEALKTNGSFILYGPFNFNGQFTAGSNENFDQHLKSQDPKMGIRDFSDIERICNKYNMLFVEKFEMPSNNFILVFTKKV